MNRGMTVRGGMTISSSSRYLLAGSRDTANESRYDVVDLAFAYFQRPFVVIPVAPMMSFQRVTLESSSYCIFTWCKVKFPGSK
ncbi:MAG: hypothetical protein ACR5K5_00725 [Wolbachia sp.]